MGRKQTLAECPQRVESGRFGQPLKPEHKLVQRRIGDTKAPPMNKVERCISVRDANGNIVRVLEHRHPVLRFMPMLSLFVLDTGETVRPLGGDAFVTAETGEKLTRVNPTI
jgi:hypothetical protein